MLTSVIFICSVLTHAVSAGDTCSSITFTRYGRPEKCKKDAYNFGNELQELEVMSQGECTTKCNSNDQCKSISYENKQTFTCELSSAVPDKEGYNMDRRMGFSYYQKGDLSSTDTCTKYKGCSHLKWIDFNVDTLCHRHNTQGSWFKDPLSPNETVYFMTSYNNIRTLYLHPNEQDYRNDKNRIQYNLPVGCDGAQGLVYGSKLYCTEYNQPKVLVFNVPDVNNYTRISFENVDGNTAGRRDQCRYQWGGYSDIDIATDEYGLWVIWGRYNQHCYFALSKINTENHTIETTYYFSVDKRSHGQAFMVCGVLYVVNTYNSNPSWIRYTFNTHNETLTSFPIRGNTIMFPTKHSYNAYTNYYHNEITGERFIAMWDNARHTKLTVTMYDP